MTSELLPGKWVLVEVIHLLNVHAVIWRVILTHVTVAALKPYQWTILPQMFAHFIISSFKITTAFEQESLALSIFSVTLKFLNCVTMDFPVLRAPVTNFNSVNGILKNLWLNCAVSVWVFTFAKAAHNSIFLRSLLTFILQKTSITNDLRTVSALFRVNWNI